MNTKLGLAIRSTAQDREVANLMGMNEARVALYTVGISIALAGFTGAVIVPLTIVEPFMWLHPLIMMMAVVVLGGLGSIKGSFFAAYILGFAEAFVVSQGQPVLIDRFLEDATEVDVDIETGAVHLHGDPARRPEAAALLAGMGYPETGSVRGVKAATARAKSFVSCAIGRIDNATPGKE